MRAAVRRQRTGRPQRSRPDLCQSDYDRPQTTGNRTAQGLDWQHERETAGSRSSGQGPLQQIGAEGHRCAGCRHRRFRLRPCLEGEPESRPKGQEFAARDDRRRQGHLRLRRQDHASLTLASSFLAVLEHRWLAHNLSKVFVAASSAGSPHDIFETDLTLNERTSVPDAIELLKIRRSIKPREMSGPGPTAGELDTILTIGARVPDHGKLTPWRFIVFEGDARARAGDVIAQVFAKKNPAAPAADIEIEKRRLMDAPLVIAVVSFTKPHPKVPAWEQELSAGASAMNIGTAATALGYGANWLTGWFAFDRDVLDGFGLKPDEKIAGFIHLGPPSEPKPDRPRPALSEIVTRF